MDTSCKPCDLKCKSCSSALICTSCKNPTLSLQSNCISCPDGQYFEGSGCKVCDTTTNSLIVVRRGTDVPQKECVPSTSVSTILNCGVFRVVNGLFQCQSCDSNSQLNSNVIRKATIIKECVNNDVILKARSKCLSFKQVASTHYCSSCQYPYSLKFIPNADNKPLFECI